MDASQQQLIGKMCKEIVDAVLPQIVHEMEQKNKPVPFNEAFRDRLVTLGPNM